MSCLIADNIQTTYTSTTVFNIRKKGLWHFITLSLSEYCFVYLKKTQLTRKKKHDTKNTAWPAIFLEILEIFAVAYVKSEQPRRFSLFWRWIKFGLKKKILVSLHLWIQDQEIFKRYEENFFAPASKQNMWFTEIPTQI